MPGWGLTDPITTKQATITDAMSHRTGLARHDISYGPSNPVPTIVSVLILPNFTVTANDRRVLVDTQIKRLKYHRPSAEFRDVWQYNNNTYILLSYLPTLLFPSKIPFTRHVKRHIFDPLSLTSTTYSYDVANASGQISEGMARQGINKYVDVFRGNSRALPFWAPQGGEDGNGKL